MSDRMSACFNKRTADRILIKFYMDVVPLEATLHLYFLTSYTSMACTGTCEMGSTLAQLNRVLKRCMVTNIKKKCTTFVVVIFCAL
jgi:hypothetical protein